MTCTDEDFGKDNVVVALNKADMVNDEKSLEAVELRVRKLLNAHDFPGDDVPVVRISALKALEGDPAWVKSVQDLMDTVDENVPQPGADDDKPFLMAVEDVHTITGRGTVVTGRIERGVLRVNESVDIIGIRDTKSTTVTSIEMFNKFLDEARAGDSVGLLLRGVKSEEVDRGQCIVQPGSATVHTTFEAAVYLLAKKEGGRSTPFPSGDQAHFYIRTTDITGAVTLTEGVEKAMPGDNVGVAVELLQPVALEEGLRFTMNEGGRTIGTGQVTRIIR